MRYFIIVLCVLCLAGTVGAESLQDRIDNAGPKIGGSNHEWVECPYCHNYYARGEDEQYHSCFQNKHLRRIEDKIDELKELADKYLSKVKEIAKKGE